MFYLASQVLWPIFAPSVFSGILVLGLSFFALFRRSRTAATLAAGILAFLIAAIMTPMGMWLMAPLEQTFPVPTLIQTPDGIIALGGESLGQRIPALALLSRQFPNAVIILSGQEADKETKNRFSEFGGVASRLVIEDTSRNTDENARYTAALVKPTQKQNWILITSALHMPRAIGCFRHAGFRIQGYPVDFMAGLASQVSPPWGSPALRMLDLAVKEWIGLIVYRIFDKTDAFWPSPVARPQA